MDKILCHSVISSDDVILIDKNSVDPFGDGSGKALWKLDGNGTDVSGVYSMTRGSPSWTTGIDGQCASLTGSTHQVLYRGQETTLQLNNHTLSCWVKTNAIGTSQYVLVNQSRAAASGTGYNEGSLIKIASDGKIQGIYLLLNNETITDSNGNTLTTYAAAAHSSFVVTVGQWYHVAWVVNTNHASMYIDGVLNCTVSSVQNIRWSNDTTYHGRVCIGGLVEDQTQRVLMALNGSVEQCRIFNRGLTATEVTALYNEI